MRYKSRFPTLLGQTYNSDQFEFRMTYTQRTAASALAFAYGLFGPENKVKFQEPITPDMLLKAYENCKKYKESVPKLAQHINNFHNTTFMTTLKETVSERLGFNETITIDDINAMYEGCRFDHAWNHKVISPWCAVFTDEELKILEYREDLLNYYYNGYGNKFCKKVGCPPVKDFLGRLSELEKCKNQPAGVFYFTHSEMLQKSLLPLRIAMDEQPLTSCNYKQNENRRWRTSKLMPFAANLVAVIFKMFSNLLLLWVILLIYGTGAQNETRCYADVENPYVKFATHTAYDDILNENVTPIVVENCQPKQFWLISRHGTRYPAEDGITSLQSLNKIRDDIVNNHEVLQSGQLCPKDLENLKKWNLQLVTTLASNLAPHGYEDLYNLAKRYKSRFPELLNQSYTQDQFQIRFSNTQRTTASAFAFVEGIFGPSNRVYLPEPSNPDMLLKPYDNCGKWQALWPSVADEELKFQNGTLMTSLLQNVSNRLGFSSSMSIDDINAMYDGCTYDHAWHRDVLSPWCAVFTDEELQIMEYREDLLYYYYTGYGTNMNAEMGCSPVKDFIDRFSEIEEGKQQPSGVFYFTHSEMLQLLLLPLGIAKDQKNLTASNYEEMKNRQWKTSNITPFAANLVVVFFKCGDVVEEYKVQFYHNEHPIQLDGCRQELCEWSLIKQKFGSLSSNCNYNFC